MSNGKWEMHLFFCLWLVWPRGAYPYNNNANAKKVINKFAKGGLLAPKTKENAIKIINKKMYDIKVKDTAQQKLLENAERNSAAFDEFLKRERDKYSNPLGL